MKETFALFRPFKTSFTHTSTHKDEIKQDVHAEYCVCVFARVCDSDSDGESEGASRQREGGILLLWADLQSQGQGHSDFLLVAEVT